MADEHKIDQDSDTLENLPPEELQKRIEEDKKRLKESSVLAVTALIAIIVVCMAWFVNNTQVRLTGMNIMATNSINFELASSGDAQVIDTRKKLLQAFIEKIGGIAGDAFQFSNASGTVTSATKSSIAWNMSPKHENFANVEGSGMMDDTGDENIGLQPGTYGALTFYIIPKIDGAQTVNCTLSMTAYADSFQKGSVKTDGTSISFDQGDNGSEKQVWKITDTRINKILGGHIYFFMKKENNLYSEWLEPDENGLLHFSVELNENTKKDTPKTVTIYWNWPMLISQVLLKGGDSYLGERRQLFAKETQDEIVRFMCDESTEHSGFFFIAANDTSGTVEKSSIQKIHSSSWSGSDGNITKEEYSSINQPYNNADQFLGKTVSYVSLELSATN